MEDKSILVSVIIPTYKDWDRLKLCLDALYSQSYDQEQFEILVVNNDPNDSFNQNFAFLNKNVTFLDEKKTGSYAARNKALTVATGKYVGFTDSDCIPDKNWIKNAVKIFENKPEVDRIGGKIKLFYPNKNVSIADLYDETYAFPQKDYVEGGFAVTGNLFVRMKVLDNNYFDEELESGGDLKWGLNSTKKGFSIVYSPDVLINHPTRSTVEELVRKMKRVGKGLRKASNAGKQYSSLHLMLFYLKNFCFKYITETGQRNPSLSLKNKLLVSALHAYILYTRDKEKYRS
ncbi:MAG: hypothetical protein BGO86_05860 [Chryseobacterium sp. 36-9]|nr:MAG: hypothetical protein BGO86_05860 [Chryseobacterium sp. 36-9]